MTIDKLIPGKESDRLLIAIAAAFLVQGILALLLGFIDWETESTLKQEYGPVEVQLSSPEPLEPEPEELPEELSPEAPEEPQPSPEAPEEPQPSAAVSPRSDEAARSDEPETSASDEQASRQERSSDAGRDEQIPSIAEALREAREAEESGESREASGAPTQEMTAPAEERDQPEARRDPDAREDRPPVPEQEEEPQEQYSEGSRVELQEKPEETAEGMTSGREQESAAREQQQEPSVFDEGVLDKIGPKDSGERPAEADDAADGSRTATGSQQTGRTGGAAEEGTAGETGQTRGKAGVEVDFDSEGVSRRLQYRPDPELNEEQVAKLPPEIELTLSFRLDPSGIITSVSVLNGSGDTEVDTQIRQAVSKWRFDRSEGAGPVEGTFRIILRTGG